MTRVAVVDKKLCQPDKCQLECMAVCPINRVGKECIVLTPDKVQAIISETLCVDCGLCIKKCPFHAIEIINIAQPLDDKLVFDYGTNSFKQYNLILPRKGIMGVVGENGCGKTTNVKLLTGQLKPKSYPTKEAKAFFESQKQREIVVKPQEIAAIKGNVKSLLQKLHDEEMLLKMERVFDLQRLYERDLQQLSGGELQQVAVTAALCNGKDTIILDEPFAFLDYAYRIRLVEFLKQEFNETEKQLLVIDHDLSLMSYLCPQIYILYGTPAVFGIASKPYSSERALNMFLEGFIDAENTRFRAETIKYKERSEAKKREKAFEIPSLKVKKGLFELENQVKIEIKKGEVVGIAGSNGIGKSTLAAELAGKMKAPLKQQQLHKTNEIVGAGFAATPFSINFRKALNLDKLEFYNESNLSGGELQKVEILKVLQNEKNIFFLDEPTNMLDVNARIHLSKLLGEKAESENATILIVDHDLEFLLNTVDRIIVMDGTPSKQGFVEGIYDKEEGVRKLMEKFDLTYRKDPITRRLKLNKRGSQKDISLKESGKYIEK